VSLELLVIIFLGFVLAALVLYAGYQVLFMVTMLHGPVFVVSADDKLETMLKLPKLTKKSRVIDLGAGDGKVLIELVKKYDVRQAVGVEINPLLVWRSRKNIKRAGLTNKIEIKRQSFWKIDFSQYDVVFLYGTTYIMQKLEEKLKKEMKSGAQFVSNYFKLPNLKPSKSKNKVYLYRF
jgi:spermidine synthase